MYSMSANPIDELGAAVDRVDEVDKTVDLRVHAVQAKKRTGLVSCSPIEVDRSTYL